MDTNDFIKQFDREELSKYVELSSEHDLWYYRILGVTLAYQITDNIENILTYNRNLPLSSAISGMGSLQMSILNLNLLFQVDEMLLRNYVNLLYSPGQDFNSVPDLSIHEHCENTANFLTLHLKKQKL